MSNHTLQLDLLREARGRLMRWYDDTVMRCGIARLPEHVTFAIVNTALFEAIAAVAQVSKMSEKTFLAICSEEFRRHTQRQGQP